jgi:hypothetical protein
LDLESVREDFRLSARVGDAASEERVVKVVERPGVADITTVVAYPPYTGLQTSTVAGGDVTALEGSRAAAALAFTKPVVSIAVAFENAADVAPQLSEDGMSARIAFDVSDNTSYSITVRDEYGFDNRPPLRFSVTALQDARPSLALARPDRDLTVVPTAVIPLECEANDDFGIRFLRLVYTITRPDAEPREGEVLLAAHAPPAAHLDVAYSWPLSSLNLSPGDSLSYHLVAEDNRPETPQTAASDERSAVVVTVADKLAELQRMQIGIQANLHALQRRQRETRDALAGFAGAPEDAEDAT